MAEDFRLLNEAYAGTMSKSQKDIAQEVVRLGALLIRKQEDYGGSIWRSPVLAPDCDPGVAIRVRMSDKISRLASLLEKGKSEVGDESIDDTLRDLAGYCLLELARPR